MKIKNLILIVFVFSGFVSLKAQEAKSWAKLDTTTINIGDQTSLEIGLELPKGSLFSWPQFNDTITKNIEIISRSKIDSTINDNHLMLKQKFVITSFDSGNFELPQIQFHYGIDTSLVYSATSPAVFLKVNVPQVDTSQAFKPIILPYKEPITIGEILPWVLIGLLVIALIIGIIWFIRSRKSNKAVFRAKAKPLPPADILALSKLDELRLSKLWQQGKIKSYHSAITDIMREYIKRRFDFDAIEMTTDEIMNELQSKSNNEQALHKLKSVFELADLVKFAKAQPTALENDLGISHSVDFVNETKIVPEQKVPETSLNKEKGGSDV